MQIAVNANSGVVMDDVFACLQLSLTNGLHMYFVPKCSVAGKR